MTTTSIPRPEHRRHVKAADADPRARGIARGEQLRDGIPAALDAYDRLFALGSVSPPRYARTPSAPWTSSDGSARERAPRSRASPTGPASSRGASAC